MEKGENNRIWISRSILVINGGVHGSSSYPAECAVCRYLWDVMYRRLYLFILFPAAWSRSYHTPGWIVHILIIFFFFPQLFFSNDMKAASFSSFSSCVRGSLTVTNAPALRILSPWGCLWARGEEGKICKSCLLGEAGCSIYYVLIRRNGDEWYWSVLFTGTLTFTFEGK